MRTARERGFAIDDEEYILGVRAVAAPIGSEGHPMYAIWVVGFKASLDERRMKELTEYTRDAAKSIEHGIEGRSAPPPSLRETN
jgi:DNA-binding IclR family transcriptional regulator